MSKYLNGWRAVEDNEEYDDTALWEFKLDDYFTGVCKLHGEWRVTLYAGKEMRILYSTREPSVNKAIRQAIDLQNQVLRGYTEVLELTEEPAPDLPDDVPEDGDYEGSVWQRTRRETERQQGWDEENLDKFLGLGG